MMSYYINSQQSSSNDSSDISNNELRQLLRTKESISTQQQGFSRSLRCFKHSSRLLHVPTRRNAIVILSVPPMGNKKEEIIVIQTRRIDYERINHQWGWRSTIKMLKTTLKAHRTWEFVTITKMFWWGAISFLKFSLRGFRITDL
jgi:hypothetical protein